MQFSKGTSSYSFVKVLILNFRNFTHLAKGGKSNNLPSLMNIMMQLRKCCNHPFLLKGVEEYELAEKAHHEHMREIVEASGKLVLIDKLLPKLMVLYSHIRSS